MEKRRSYHQFCGLARALDRLGERWTLLIVRNLLLGPKRYSELLEGLPGITTNLLAARLKDMEREGLIARKSAPPPLRSHVYELAANGRALEPALMELARWGGRFMNAPAADDTLNLGWALLSLKRRYRGGLELVAELRIEGRHFELAFEPGYLAVTERSAPRPDVTLTGSVEDFRAWLFRGEQALELARNGRLTVDGSERAFVELATAFLSREARPEEALLRSREKIALSEG